MDDALCFLRLNFDIPDSLSSPSPSICILDTVRTQIHTCMHARSIYKYMRMHECPHTHMHVLLDSRRMEIAA